MQIASIFDQIVYGEQKPAVTVLLDTPTGKEIRIVFREGQEMKEHQSPYPIVVEIVEGHIDFAVEGVVQPLKKGMLIALSAAVPHGLLAKMDAVVRLSLHKGDTLKRIDEVLEG